MTDNKDPSETKIVALSLTADEAFVLFGLLSRLVDERKGQDLIGLTKHDAELWALNSALLRLERELAQPFLKEYPMLLDRARTRLAEANGGHWPWNP
jgi:hypothetical protein